MRSYPHIWNESSGRGEAYIVSSRPNFYALMEAYELWGYYPPGHPKERGRGTWGGVAGFAVKLILGIVVESITVKRGPQT